MQIDYKIVSLNKMFGQIEVNYFSSENPTGWTYSIDIPIIDGVPISGDALVNEIVTRTPTWMFERIEQLKNVDFSSIESLIAPVEPVTPQGASQPEVTNAMVF